jgi:hypothetical protein
MSNITLFKEWLGFNNNFYKYSNGNGTVTVQEIFYQGREMEKSYPKTIFKYKPFVEEFPNSKDTILFRLFKLNPFHFWRWGEFIYSWRFRLPYKNWDEIKLRRKPGFRVHQDGFTEF